MWLVAIVLDNAGLGLVKSDRMLMKLKIEFVAKGDAPTTFHLAKKVLLNRPLGIIPVRKLLADTLSNSQNGLQRD